ncbi:leucyl aminopeptidase [Tepidibacillus fermentans]|uniref:Probable cytosol aminopeptidase n=1 Tax=Tepidibacillus fermentans TaxID=1281767 RepID=A0A4R3KI01_9BACI|nr:leucyl aminopeptidase [Tepidibacillus fermentans]TCS83133.1 leucyl aminopeptidase [Tepidibacillus fermentans]
MKIEFTNLNVAEIKADLLVFGHYLNEKKPQGKLAELDQVLDGAISDLIQQGDITGKAKETVLIHTFGKIPASRVLVIGLGNYDQFDQDLIREVAAIAVKQGIKVKAKRIASCPFGINHPNVHEHHVTHSFAEGAVLAAYHFEGYRSEKEEHHQIEFIQLMADQVSEELEYGIECGTAYGLGTNLARDLVNSPGNLMTPTKMAEKAVEIARRYGMEYEVLGKEEMERLGMGGLLAVAQGSDQPPKMIVIKYRGREKWDEVLGFVGKGLTFDSGGISLKPAANMDEMKTDMAGGAAVLGAMEAIGRLRPKVNIVAVIPSTENLPSGKAYKPGDVIRTMSGKTIEVLNTDAEGRLILADGITYAKKLGATRIIDLATLTGAILVALGTVTTGAFTNDPAFLEDFKKSAKKAGEKIWQLPTFDEYKEQIKSQIADLKNTGGRNAGSITAALFLDAFAEDTPWIHLDIAGTAFTSKETPTTPKGATGVMVRSLVQIAKHYGKHGMK